jgi:carboxypeptidase D
MYVPYIASGMLDAKDTTYFNVKGIQINDPSINSDTTMIQGMICHRCGNLILTP